MARAALIDLASEHDDLIPLIWQLSDPASPGGYNRYDFFAGENIPYGIFGGAASYVGEDDAYNQYQALYQQQTDQQTPWIINPQFGLEDDGDYLITAEVSLDENTFSDSIFALFALTHHDQSNYSSLVLTSILQQQITINNAFDSVVLQQSFPAQEYLELDALRAVVLIQDMNSRQVMQAAQTPVTQLIPNLQVNLNSGPASLGIYFQSTSFPIDNLVAWEWDFQNDGTVDSYEENPYFVYNLPGTYDVKLTISDGSNSAYNVFDDLITVQDTDQIEGTVTGVWKPEFNPYIIVDDLSIPYYGELIIEPGTQIMLDYNKRINVYGKFQSIGTEQEPVIISSESSWKGIKLLNTLEENFFEFTRISNTSLSAINASYSNLQIHNSLFINNQSGSLGAALNLLGCEDVLISQSRFFNNSSSLTGGISLRSSHPIIQNSIIANNNGSMAGALVIREDSQPLLINNIIANNDAPIAAIYIDESTPEFRNNILIDQEDVFLADFNDIRIEFTISSQNIPGDNNFTLDPLFVDPTSGSGDQFEALLADWHLQSASPAIDAGDPDPAYYDIEDPQIPGFALYPAQGTLRNDIGAFGGPSSIPGLVDSEHDDIPALTNINLLAYPNPFTDNSLRSQITFMIDGALAGNITIFNVKGQRITQLPLPSNSSSITWNASSSNGKALPSGIYLTRWQNQSQSASAKLIIIQ